MTYIPKHPPWPHQQEALDQMKSREAFALLLAMRVGKTKCLLDDWGRLEAEGKCDDLLVIAPGGVYRTWEKATADHLSDELFQRTTVFTWRSSLTSSGYAEEQRKFMSLPGPRILLMNIEALSGVQRAKELATNFLSRRTAMVAIDESTAIKTPSAIRTRFVNRVLKPLANYRRILSGLPTPKSPLDLFSQFWFLDPDILGHSTFAAFQARYAVTELIKFGGRRAVPVVVAFRHTEELTELIAPHSYRKRLEDCYDMPPNIYTTREVPLTPEQKKAYAEIKEFATTQLAQGFVSATQVVTQILRMHQVLCGHVGLEGGTHVEIPEYRTRTLIDLLDEHDGKGIIWCSYDLDVRKVADAIEKANGPGTVAKFWGGNRSTREDEEKRFLNDPACRYMVATAAAGGRGRTWTVADLTVYYSNTADLEHRSQSEERAKGVDKIKSVLYVDLVAPGTVDEKMIKTLRAKINMSGAITGDNYREWLI